MMARAILLCGALLLLVVVLQSDGREAQRKSGHATHRIIRQRGSAPVRPRPPTRHRSNPGHTQTSSNRTSHKARGPRSKRFSPFDYYDSILDEGDPDLTHFSPRAYRTRVRSGTIGYLRLETPQWFRPILLKSNKTSNFMFPGSIIILTSNSLLIHSSVLRRVFPDSTFKINTDYIIYLMHDVNDKIHDRWLEIQPASDVVYPKINVTLIGNLRSGYHLFKFANHLDKFPNRWLINWRINYNEQSKSGEEVLDRYRMPDLGCFGFMYTRIVINDIPVAVNTEFPVTINTKRLRNETSCDAVDGFDEDYKPYTNIRKDGYNNGSPVFCGIQGNLRYFAQYCNDQGVNLTPLHRIANEIKEVDVGIYFDLIIMIPKIQRAYEIWRSYEAPWWFRPVFRQRDVPQVPSANKPHWYGGHIINMDDQYFLVPNSVIKTSFNPSYDMTSQWEVNQASLIYKNFENPPNSGNAWPSPVVMNLIPDKMSLYIRSELTRSTVVALSLVIKFPEDLTNTNCDHYTHEEDPNQPGVFRVERRPIFVVPDSCAKYFCFMTYLPEDEPDVEHPYTPIVCDEKLAFIMGETVGRAPTKGRLVYKINYIQDNFATRTSTYESVVEASNYGKDYKRTHLLAYKGELYEKGIAATTRKFAYPMVSNAPKPGFFKRYAGPVSLLNNYFIISDYSANLALLPGLADPPKLWTNSWTSSECQDYSREAQEVRFKHGRQEFPFLIGHVPSIALMVFLEVDYDQLANEPLNIKTFNGVESLKQCRVCTYTFNKDNKMAYFEIPVVIEFCDRVYCYGTIDPYDTTYDLTNSVHSGAPIVCGENDTILYNYPHPDHMNRAMFRGIRATQVVETMKFNENLMVDVLPPVFYRLFLTAYMKSISRIELLPSFVVLSDNFFIAIESDFSEAMSHPKYTVEKKHWAPTFGDKEPIPERIPLYCDIKEAPPNDLPFYRKTLQGTGLAIYQRNSTYEKRMGYRIIGSEVELGDEGREECWVYVHTFEPYHGVYRSHMSRAIIKNCGKKLCDTYVYGDMYRHGAPIVCDGILSYVYQEKKPVELRPKAIRISWIWSQVREMIQNDLSLYEKTKDPDNYQNLTLKPQIVAENPYFYEKILDHYKQMDLNNLLKANPSIRGPINL